MIVWKKTLALALAAALMATLLAGCSTPKDDPVQDVMGFGSDTVMLTVDGMDITAGDYFFWLSQVADNANYMYASFSEEGIPWDSDMGDGRTIDAYIKEDAMETAKIYALVEAKAAEGGYEYTEEDQAAYDEQLASTVEQMGGQEAYDNWLKTACLTAETMQKINRVSTLYSHMEEGMCREGGEISATAQDLTDYADENGLLVAKHILLRTTDAATNMALTDEEKADVRQQMVEMQAQLAEAADPIALFDSLMQQYSEDTGLSTNPDGYVFGTGEMVAEFEEATQALAPGEISGIVESEHGYHLILRLDPAESDALRAEWEGGKMDEMLQGWVNDATVETTESYDNLSVQDFYEKLTAYRQSLEETEQVDDGTADDGAGDDGATDDGAADDAGDAGDDASDEGQE